MIPRHTPNRFALESAVNEVEGDVLLLNLAITDVFGQAPKKEGDWNVFRLTGDQVRAITHADCRIFMSVRALSKAFYGLDTEKAA